MNDELTEPRVAALRGRLVRWLDASARPLPWRADRSAYRVWVSEVMLQQTRVATVIPYFQRFVARFPSIAALAGADETAVLAAWSGLGYYRRARQLHRGAADVVARFGGELPRTVDELLTVPGIGPYTAGAIASLAFGVRAPLVDGNVARVLCRLFAIGDDARASKTVKRLWALADALVPADRPGAWNEALMELGATVCVPSAPRCDECPISSSCEANRRGIADALPVVPRAKAVPTVYAAALLARSEGRVLLARRRGDALFGGMWEPPMVEADAPAGAAEALRAFSSRAAEVGTVRHVLSHRRMEIAVLSGLPRRVPAYPPIYDDVRYVADAELSLYGISTLARKIMSAG